LELPSSKNDTASQHNFVQTTIENIEDIKYKNADISPAHIIDAGGECQEGWGPVCSRNSESQHFSESHIKSKIKKYKRKMKKHNLDEISRLEVPINLRPGNSTFDDVAVNAKVRQRLGKGTIDDYLAGARRMENYEPKDFAINLKNPSKENFYRHMDYREQVERAGRGALKDDKYAYYMFWRAWGRDVSEIPYKLPK
jgi:hypothetical protein